MGELTVKIGPITGTLNFEDATGQIVIEDYIEVYGGPQEGTNAEKMQWFIRDIARHVQEVHRGHVFREAERNARTQAEQDTLDLLPADPEPEPEP